MKKILLNGVDGNFGSRSARVLLEKYPHEALIFTAPTKNGLEKYQAMGIAWYWALKPELPILTMRKN